MATYSYAFVPRFPLLKMWRKSINNMHLWNWCESLNEASFAKPLGQHLVSYALEFVR